MGTTTTLPANSSARPYPHVNLVVGGLLEILKAIQRGMVIAASLKL